MNLKFMRSSFVSEVEITHPTKNESPVPVPIKRQPHPMDRFVKENHGPLGTWKLVDWSDPISPEEEAKFSCEMSEFRPRSSGKTAEICLHTSDDLVSRLIKRDKCWGECVGLPGMWTEAASNDKMQGDNSLYVDVGGNIGSCVLEMLLSTEAKIAVFEPHPMNVYNMKKTISKLGKEYQDRVLLFPVGLGDAQSRSTVFGTRENMGNSQIGATVKDWETQEFAEHLQFDVFVERMDSLLDATKVDNIRLLKLDCQGFECKAVGGMSSLKDKIQILKFEYSVPHLNVQNCTDLVPKVKELGLDVFSEGKVVQDNLPHIGELIGKKRGT
jgi:FkbM family methyltransferase